MKSILRLPALGWLAVLLVAAVPVLAQTGEVSPREESDATEEDLGYGYSPTDGLAVIADDTIYVFSSQAPLLVVHPDFVDDALAHLQGVDNGDGTWTVTDPDTGVQVVVKPQLAAYLYSTGAAEGEPGDGTAASSVRITGEATRISGDFHVLPILPRPVIISPYPYPWWPYYRLRRFYQCNTAGRCPWGGCLWGYQWSQLRPFRVCGYTGRPWDFCLEFLYPVCRLTRYTCRDCTGPILWQADYRRWVCAL